MTKENSSLLKKFLNRLCLAFDTKSSFGPKARSPAHDDPGGAVGVVAETVRGLRGSVLVHCELTVQ